MQHSSFDADLDLPSVMTCANYIKLPPYSSKVCSLIFLFDQYTHFLGWLIETYSPLQRILVYLTENFSFQNLSDCNLPLKYLPHSVYGFSLKLEEVSITSLQPLSNFFLFPLKQFLIILLVPSLVAPILPKFTFQTNCILAISFSFQMRTIYWCDVYFVDYFSNFMVQIANITSGKLKGLLLFSKTSKRCSYFHDY